jgi:peptidyl-prolyl cis-trans isomerase B (cyclophilin B)
MKQSLLSFSLGLFVLATLPACGQNQSPATSATDNTQQVAQTDKTTSPAQAPQSATTNQKGTMQDVAVLDTNLGKIVIAFYPDKAPGHVKNFEDLAKKGFYDGTKFHRVIPGFMILGGDPNSKGDNRETYGTGGPGYTINAEFNDISHKRGIVSMARSSDPNSAGSQFFIVVKDSPFLDKNYTVFGHVIEGMDIADKIVNLPRDERDDPLPANPAIIKSVKVEQREVPKD